MKKVLWSLPLLVLLGLSGCGSDSGAGGTTGGTSTTSVSYALPQKLSFVNLNTNTPSAQTAIQTALYSDPQTDYDKLSAYHYNDQVGDEPMQFVNVVLEFLKQIRFEENIGTGEYLTQYTEASSNEPRIINLTSVVTKQSDHLRVDIQYNSGSSVNVRFKIYQGVSKQYPFGKFILDFQSPDGSFVGHFEADTVDGKPTLRFYNGNIEWVVVYTDTTLKSANLYNH